jgi:heme/copper-type cytochrome/quinol oxidase subunit 2
MLFIICFVISIISIFLAWFLDRADNDLGSLISGIVAVPFTFAAITMLIVIFISLYNVTGTEAKWQETYKSLNTRIENHMYSDEDRNELIEAVQQWNENFSAQEKTHGNFWVGIFNLESIEGLDKIDLTRIK